MSDETPWVSAPWEVDEGGYSIVGDGWLICQAPKEPYTENKEANLRLIASAPRMAELLERLQRVGDREHDQLSRLSQEAIDEIDTLLTEIKGDE